MLHWSRSQKHSPFFNVTKSILYNACSLPVHFKDTAMLGFAPGTRCKEKNGGDISASAKMDQETQYQLVL